MVRPDERSRDRSRYTEPAGASPAQTGTGASGSRSPARREIGVGEAGRYDSNESGQNKIYVQSFPNLGHERILVRVPAEETQKANLRVVLNWTGLLKQ